MRHTYRTCKNCLWRDKCAQATACEHFDPADDIEDFEAYEDDLRERGETYGELVNEQNS